jgi:hypothetical protein
MPHLAFTLLTALLLSAGLSLVGNRPPDERIYAAIYLFLCCLATTVAGSWMMHWIHG